MRDDRERLHGDDEIDVFELVGGLWRRRGLIVLTATIVGGAAVLYALFATPIYEAKVFVQPPSQNDIAQLNYGRGGALGLVCSGSRMCMKSTFAIFSRSLCVGSSFALSICRVCLRMSGEAHRMSCTANFKKCFH